MDRSVRLRGSHGFHWMQAACAGSLWAEGRAKSHRLFARWVYRSSGLTSPRVPREAFTRANPHDLAARLNRSATKRRGRTRFSEACAHLSPQISGPRHLPGRLMLSCVGRPLAVGLAWWLLGPVVRRAPSLERPASRLLSGVPLTRTARFAPACKRIASLPPRLPASAPSPPHLPPKTAVYLLVCNNFMLGSVGMGAAFIGFMSAAPLIWICGRGGDHRSQGER